MLTPVTAMIGAANADAAAAETVVAFPLPAAGPGSASAARALAEAASRRGARGARVFGHPGAPPWHLPEVVNAALGVIATVLGALGVIAGLWLTVAVVLLAAARVLGVRNPWLPRRPSWSVVIGPLRAPPTPSRILVSVVDREHVSDRLPRVVLGGACVALASEGLGPGAAALAALGLFVVATWARWMCRPVPPAAGALEGDAADAVVRYTAAHPTVPAVLAGASFATAGGAAAALDWYDVRPDATALDLVGRPDAVERAAGALTQAGWTVRVITPDELRRQV